jgi:probable rRNA maturation factor
VSPQSLKVSGAPKIVVMMDERAWKLAVPDIVKQVKLAAGFALEGAAAAMRGAEIAVLLSNDSRLQMLNRQYRAADKPTNVLSFPAVPGTSHLGDIAISYETSRREADAAGKPLQHHLLHLTVHGVLHLLGYDHQRPAEADRMEALEAEILLKMGIPDPYRVRSEAVRSL